MSDDVPSFVLWTSELITDTLITDYFEPALSRELRLDSRLGLGRHWPRSPVLVNGNECKGTFCDPASGVAGSASAPGLNSDGHRCESDPSNGAVEADFIAYEHRFMKDHAVNGNGCATTTATAAGSIGRRHIHLRH
jgi:hypothetical protein